MATVIVKRPSRRPAPEIPAGELLLDPPPEIPAPTGRQWTQLLMMLPMVAMMGAMLLMFSGSIGGPLRLVIYGIFGLAMVGMLLASLLQSSGPGKREMGWARRIYLRGLAQHRVRVNRSIDRQRIAMRYLHPDPEALWAIAASYRLWERRRTDADFGVARIGAGTQSPATALIAPETPPLEQLEPLSALALRRFIATFTAIPHLPLAIAVNGFGRIHVQGDETAGRAMVRALLAQLATLHSPDDLRIAVCAGDRRRADWEWTKWLPHALHPEKTDALGSVRLLAPAITAIEAMLDDLLGTRQRFDPLVDTRPSGPHLVVVLDGGSVVGSDHLMSGRGVEGVTVIDLSSTPPRALDQSAIVLDVGPDGVLTSFTIDGEAELGLADGISVEVVEGLARQLAPLRLTTGAHGEQPLSAELGLAELLEIGDPYEFAPAGSWQQRPNRERLRLRFGIQPDGTPIEIDLKESAQDGMGPHGLLIGATGSGKSELLRTLVLGLAVTHPPSSLNFALIDFKGGASFTRMQNLPHTSAVITNLADELHLVDRMTDALNGELIRRQELLRAAGNFSSLRDYEKARMAGAPLEEVPTLLVVCDEFSELLTAKPDFIDMFVQIGRVGRSLGVHLLLASQRLEEGRLRGLDTHLSYRIGLRTFSDMDSRAVLGTGDAFQLPRAPGHGFLKNGTEPMIRFRSAYVSGVHQRATDAAPVLSAPSLNLQEYSSLYQAPLVEDDAPGDPEPDTDELVGETLLDILVDRLVGQGKPAHQVWLPPLEEPPTLDKLLGDLVVDRNRGLTAAGKRLTGSLTATIGIVDRPLEQRHDPLVLDFSAAAGHGLVIGAPHSGKSTALRSIVTSMALTHTPEEIQFYCLDFGGGTLAGLAALPHVGGVAARQSPGAVRRTVAEVRTVLEARERLFAQHQIDGMATYRRLRAEGRLPGEHHGDVFLVVDGWATLKAEYEDVEEIVTTIGARGLSYGIHLIVSCARSTDLRMATRDLFGTRLELRIGDPIDSILDRRAAVNVPADEPGRGISQSLHQMIVALPRIDGRTTVTDLTEGVVALTEQVASHWPGPSAPPVRMLPEQIEYAELPVAATGGQLTIGLSERDLGPARIDIETDSHLIAFGDAESGKTNLLRVVARQIMARYLPQEARIIVVDHRRGLLGEVGPEYLLGFGTDRKMTGHLMTEVARGLTERLPGAEVTPDQLRSRSWWQGPELFILIDDYDLVADTMENPFLVLMDFVPQARDLGLHMFLTRRMGGAGRALYEKFVARLRDTGAPGLMLSGSKEEGQLLGGLRPQQLPPGRGQFVRRREAVDMIQVAWAPPGD